MYEELTALIPALQRENFGDHKTIAEEDYYGRGNFGEAAHRLKAEIRHFVEKHPEFNLTQYSDILDANGLWGGNAAENADVEKLDGKVVMALLVAAWRVDRIYGGTFVSFYESGHILKWLERLKAIDET